jgi:sulfotransferase
MIKKTYYFLAGLPRSGSTVLAAILNQNPAVYVTPTSPLLDQLIENQNIWHNLQTVKANPVPDQLTNITRAMIDAMWAHRPEGVIIDKNRGWGKNMPASSILFGKDIPVIATVRDLPSIMASWLSLIKQHPNHISRVIRSRGFEPTDENILAEMWFNMVQDCMAGLCQLKQDAGDRLLLIDYDNLVSNPTEQLVKVEQFLNLPKWDYNLAHIENDTVDDDAAAWGIPHMHTIRPTLSKTSKSAKEVLGDLMYHRFVELEKQYQ